MHFTVGVNKKYDSMNGTWIYDVPAWLFLEEVKGSKALAFKNLQSRDVVLTIGSLQTQLTYLEKRVNDTVSKHMIPILNSFIEQGLLNQMLEASYMTPGEQQEMVVNVLSKLKKSIISKAARVSCSSTAYH